MPAAPPIEPESGFAARARHVASSRLPTEHGLFTCHVYVDSETGAEHMALVAGDVSDGAATIDVRLHSECLTGDALGSLRCDCGAQLADSLKRISLLGRGVVVYMRGHEGRGIGLANKIRAYALQDRGSDTVDANLELGLPVDARRYDAGVAILRQLGVRSVRLMSNNPLKFAALEAGGIGVVARVALDVHPNPENERYLETKQKRLGHIASD